MKPPNLSPTAYKTFSSCPRKWWFEKVAGRRPPPTPALELGTAVHSVIESYLLTGRWGGPFDRRTVTIAQAGQQYLEPLRRSVADGLGYVETAYKSPAGDFAALPVFCKVDYRDAVAIVDHKTTSRLNGKWHHDEQSLGHDPQLLFYAGMALRAGDVDLDHIQVSHIYFGTRQIGSRMLSAVVPRARIEKTLRDYQSVALEMHQHWRLTTEPDEMRANASACSDFGGCPHAAYCSLHTTKGPASSGGTRGGMTMMGLKERLAARQRALAEKATVDPAAVNPPDSPGTETPTAAQLEECADAVLMEVDTAASLDEIRDYLLSAPGRALRAKHGLGVSAVASILKLIDPSAKVQVVEEAPEPTPEPEPTVDAPASEPVVEDPTPTPDRFGVVMKIVSVEGGRARHDADNVKAAIRAALGTTRLGSKAKMRYLAEGAEAGVWDYSATEIILPGADAPDIDAEALELAELIPSDTDVPSDARTHTVQRAEPDIDRASRLAREIHDDAKDLVRLTEVVQPEKSRIDNVIEDFQRTEVVQPAAAVVQTNGTTPDTLVLVGCMLSDGGAVAHIDNVLADVCAEVCREQGVDHVGLVEYGKGPALVVARARNLQFLAAHTFIPAGHWAEKYTRQLFPGVPVVRALR